MCICRGHDIEVISSGVTVTLIDFTLSRLTTVMGDVAFCNLAADPELFAGPKGDVQVRAFVVNKIAAVVGRLLHCNVCMLRHVTKMMLMSGIAFERFNDCIFASSPGGSFSSRKVML